MLTRTRLLLVALLLTLAAVACTPDDATTPKPGATDGSEAPESSSEASDEPTGVSSPIGDEPLGDDEVTLHMANPPELPSALEGAEVAPAELRTADATDRHVVQLVDVPAGTTTLEEPLSQGAVLRVPVGQTLEVNAAVDVASLDPDATDDAPGVIDEVESPCASPCAVEGPALVTEEGWMPGFGIAPTWQLLVPGPSN